MAGTRHFDPVIARAKARVAGLTSVGADPDRIAQARAELKAAGLEARIRRDVASWPPLSGAQRDQLALLLHQDGGADA